MTNAEQLGQRTQQEPQVAMIVARLVVPLGIMLTYWAIRLPMFESPHRDPHVGAELAIALTCTVIGICLAGASLVSLYRRIVED
jgi:hypothetical protein